MDYQEARAYIEEAGKYGMVLGLSTMKNLLARLGNPQDKLSFIHIAGTNGKGSVGACLSGILGCSGIKTGHYVSPVLFSYEERIQLRDKAGVSYISKWNVAKWMSTISFAIEEMVADGLAHPTPFEIETAMAFLEFEFQGCGLVVLETGLGGRLDGTNVIKTGVCQVFTAISRDHMKILGESLSEIAEEKAGIIKKGIPVVSWPQEAQAEMVLEKKAEKMESRFCRADFSELVIEEMNLSGTRFQYKGMVYETALLGEYQPKNAVVAIEAARELKNQGFPVTEAAIEEGIRTASWPGRFTIASKKPLIIIDGAHNEAAAASLAKSLKQYFPELVPGEKRLVGVVGVFRDKEYDEILKKTLPLMRAVYTLKPEGPRGLEAETLAACARKYCTMVHACKDAGEAVKKAIEQVKKEEDAVIVYGSLSFLHEVTEMR